MSDFINNFENEMNADAAATQRRETAERRDKLRAEKDALDYQHENDVAKANAVAERKVTLDWAWVAAGLLVESKVVPTIWTYTWEKRKFLGSTTMQGIATQGWALLDWQNTRYEPQLRHTLLLTPTDEGNSGIHLSYFSETPSYESTYDDDDDEEDEEPAPQLHPSDVHSLSKEPLSPLDMPWPPRTNTPDLDDAMNGVFHTKATPKPAREAPWKDKNSITVDEYDDGIELDRLYAEIDPTGQMKRGDRPPTQADYTEYKKAGIENSIRRAIAHVAAEHLVVSPSRVAQTIKRRAELGIE